MLLRCTETFETREGGYPRTIDEGTVWYKTRCKIAPGGYELVQLERIDGAAFTGDMVWVRLMRTIENFDSVPPIQCPEPIGCTEYYDG